jgi:hypothetical protein
VNLLTFIYMLEDSPHRTQPQRLVVALTEAEALTAMVEVVAAALTFALFQMIMHIE